MERAIQDFIDCKRIALIGFSRTGRKFGNSAYKELRERGYEVFVVHPTEKEIAGVPCYPNLKALEGRINGVFISLPGEKAVPVLYEAAALGLKNVWLQQGAEASEALETARKLGLNIVTRKCVLMYASPVRSFHRWHRGFVKLVGRL